MNFRRFTASAVITFALIVVGSAAAWAQANTVVGIGPGMYFEDGTMDGEEQASVQITDETFNYISDGTLNFSVWWLAAVTENLRMGATIMYYGSYTASIQEEDNNDDEEEELYEFGSLWEFYGRIEYLVPTYEGLDVMFGAVAGIPVLFPDGEFQEEIDRLRDQQASVWDLPRIGYMVGPIVSMRYGYSDYLFFRLDLALKWEQLLLFNTSEEVQGVAFGKDWTISTLRSEFTLGIEVGL